MIILKTVSLEEKLNAQIKNIIAILSSDNSLDAKIMMYEMQKDYLVALLESISEQLNESNQQSE